MSREVDFFKARGVVVRQIRPSGARIGALYECAFDSQSAKNKNGWEVEISSRTTACAPIDKIARQMNLQDGSRVIALVDPRDPSREGRIIGARP